MDTQVLGTTVAKHDLNSLSFNMKLIVPTCRIQPYIILGMGAQCGSVDAKGAL